MLYQSASREKILNALSDLILIIQFFRLVLRNKKKDFVLTGLRQSACAGQVVLHGVRS